MGLIIGDELGRQARPGLGISKFEQIMIDHLPPFDPTLTVARYMILKPLISTYYKGASMYLVCLFCLFVYVDYFRIHL